MYTQHTPALGPASYHVVQSGPVPRRRGCCLVVDHASRRGHGVTIKDHGPIGFSGGGGVV